MTDATAPRVTPNPRVRLPSALLWLLAFIAALGLGWFLGDSSRGFPLESSAEVRFTRDMRAHHEQAVDMSLRLLERTEDFNLKLFLKDIILTQQNQAGQMTAWLALWGRPQNGSDAPMQGMAQDMGMARQADVERLSTLPVPQAEILFLQLMHRHHQGGVMMAEQVFEANPQIDVARMAQGIVSGQRLELKIIESFLRQRNASIPATLSPMRMPAK
jgi:uncharacterized protein (DUF305 family)